jgi:outer membrane lipoprotein-sorting protein
MLPATIVTKHYANDTLGMTSSYVFSDIDINEGLSDSVFECVPLP